MYSKVREKSRSKSKSKTQKQQTTESTKVIHTVPQGEKERNGINVQIPVEVIAECQSEEAIQKSGSKTRSDSKVTRNRSSSRKEKKRNNKATSSSSSNSSEIESVPIAAPRTLRSRSVGKNIRHSGTPPPRRGGRFTDTSFAYSLNNHGDTAKGGKRGERNKKYEMEHFSRTEVENVYASPDEVVYEVPVIQTKPIKGILKNWNTDIHQVHGFKYPSVIIPANRFHYNDESFYNVDINNASALAYKPSSSNGKQQCNDWKSQFAYMHPAHSTRRSRSQSRGAEGRESAEHAKGGFDQNLSGGGESSGAGGGIPYLDSTKHICFMSGEEGGADCNYMDKISINHAEMDGTQQGSCNGTHEEEKKDTINVKNSCMISSSPYTRHRLYKNYEEEESFEI